MMRPPVLFLVILSAFPADSPKSVVQRAGVTRSGAIVGVTVDAITRSPVPGATLTLTGGPPEALRGRPSLLSNASGRFVFADLPVGVYGVLASAPGYLNGAAGQFSALASPGPVVLAGQPATVTVEIQLWRAAVVRGTVMDDAGKPLVGVAVFAWQPDDRFVSTPQGPRSAVTDDRGQFRVGNLGPGDYLVGALAPILPDSEGSDVEPRRLVSPVFYPGVRDASAAQVLSLEPGQVASDVVFAVPAEKVSGLSGKLIGPAGPAALIAVRLTKPLSDGGPEAGLVEIARTRTDKQGTFRFSGIPRGEYLLLAAQSGENRFARGGSAAGPVMWARITTSVDPEARDITVALQGGLSVKGRVQWEVQGPGVETARGPVMVSLRPVGSARPFEITTDASAEVHPDGTFALGPLLPGRYSLRVVAGQGWEALTVSQGGREMFTRRLSLVTKDLEDVHFLMTRTRTEVQVTLTGHRPNDAAVQSVVIFPADTIEWASASVDDRRFQRGSVQANGKCTLSGMPPGKYLVAILSRSAPSIWQRVDVLRTLRATSLEVNVLRGERRIVVVPVSRLP